jgi:hypothetical protein
VGGEGLIVFVCIESLKISILIRNHWQVEQTSDRMRKWGGQDIKIEKIDENV